MKGNKSNENEIKVKIRRIDKNRAAKIENRINFY